MRAAIACAVVASLAGCGLGITEERSGGGDNLPTLGAGPYVRIPFDVDTPLTEPFVLGARGESFEHPSALPRAGGGFRLWFDHLDLDEPDPQSEIWYAELASLRELPAVGPEPALLADAAWEAGRVARPNVIEVGAGYLVMFYEAGDPAAPAVGRADSSDGGRTWQKHPDNPLLTGVGEPGAAVIDGAWMLYVTRPDADGIFRADSADGVGWELAPDPVVIARPDTAEAFDRFDVGDPFAVAFRSEAGQVFHGLFFNGTDGPNEDSDVAVGYAGSFDTETWERFNGIDPVLITREVPVEGPTVVIESTRGFMFFSEVSAGRGKIAVATHL